MYSAGFPVYLSWALSSAVFGRTSSGQPFSSQSFAHLATSVFTRLFIALLKLKPFKQTIVLNLLFQDPHGLFNIVVDDPDFNIFQIPRPLLLFNFIGKVLKLPFSR